MRRWRCWDCHTWQSSWTSISIASADVFDPEGDGEPENDQDVPLAYDSDPATAWSTLTYRGSPAFGNLKPGVGLLLDLGNPQQARIVELRFFTGLTVEETAEVLGAAQLPKTIVLTGAMIPYEVKNSDALFNFGFACGIAQTLPHGVYIAMNARIFTWDDVRKNRTEGVFEQA